MATPFKMKGSPMQRNFGIGASPVKKEEGTKLLNVKTGEERTDYGDSFTITKKGKGPNANKPRTRDNMADWVELLPEVKVEGKK